MGGGILKNFKDEPEIRNCNREEAGAVSLNFKDSSIKATFYNFLIGSDLQSEQPFSLRK